MNQSGPRYSTLHQGQPLGSPEIQHHERAYGRDEYISYGHFNFPRYTSNYGKPAEQVDWDKQQKAPNDSLEIDPAAPQLAPLPRPRWQFYIVDILNFTFSALFFALGIAVAALRGKEESEWGQKVIQATRLAPSIWPILFAAVLGNAVKAFANWKVERGSQLGTLELLMGSQTVAATLRTIFFLKFANLYSVILIVLWAFNPLGSQASLRSVYLTDYNATAEFGAAYPQYTFDMSGTGLDSGSPSGWPMFRSIFSTGLYSLEAKTQYRQVPAPNYDSVIQNLGGVEAASVALRTDAWGNVRIPRLMSLSGYDAEDQEKWVNVPKDIVDYWSLVGVPARAIENVRNGSYTFEIGASFVDLECEPWTKMLWDDPNNYLMKNADYLQFTFYNKTKREEFDAFENKTLQTRFLWDTAFPNQHLAGFAGFYFDIENKTTSAEEYLIEKTHIYFASVDNIAEVTGRASITRCGVESHYVNTRVLCEAGDTTTKTACRAVAVQRMRNESLPSPNSSMLKIIPINYHFHNSFPKLLNPIVEQRYTMSSEMEFYLMDPVNAFNNNDEIQMEMSKLPIDIFSRRLTLVLNSFWRSTIRPAETLGRGFEFLTTSTSPEVPVTLIEGRYHNTTAQATYQMSQRYAVSPPWIVIFFFGNGIMVVATLACVYFRYSCRCPEMLAYVSSAVRDNPNFPEEVRRSSTLDGIELSRELRRLVVKSGDVRPQDQTGKLGLSTARNTAKPLKQRMYI